MDLRAQQPDQPGEPSVPPSDGHAVATPAPTPSPLPAIVTATVGIAVAVVLGVVVNARVGALVLALMLAALGTWRSTSAEGPAGLAIRSRGVDVFVYWTAALAIAVLALTAPGLA